ncbi:steroid oxidoreductase superfamily protein [Schizosaccharomyces japonicus yFS275]|uniref:Steroid oxidoreductase superfamily protein n=1 Tax=Schizosaccharomyces japonicus (strain yFS275 / FY16936) TaxID=402676 RepID=B6K0D3_SCHJY|nr:steroid oxidoreductase superfamily protein [Schizosaccharomyces japonicus yFS275]EEB06283.1 steroid oxidoreductase superfamily protein [Schizosaccharomyces japonicus yFS275]
MTLATTLPAIFEPRDASLWSLAVAPFLSQAANISLFLGGKIGLCELYINTNPLVFGFELSIVLAFLLWIVSLYTHNPSQVDRCWPLLPTLFSFHYLVYAKLFNLSSKRLTIVCFLQAVWCIRLVFNYWRKGGYKSGAEDYRWVYAKRLIPRWAYPLFHLFFIHIFQVCLLFSLSAPTYLIMLSGKNKPFGLGDIAVLQLFMLAFFIEILADQQQWDYYRARNFYRRNKVVPQNVYFDLLSLARGFNTSGLFRFIRHPNFAAEQTIWFAFYLFGAVATNSILNWTIIGWLGLVAVFTGSTWLTESISSEKYVLYAKYQQKVGRFLPKFNGSHWQEEFDDESLKTD